MSHTTDRLAVAAVCIGLASLTGLGFRQATSESQAWNEAICHQVNIVRTSSNATGWLDYQTNAELATIVLQPALLATLPPVARAQRRTEAAHLRANITKITWDPLTNCKHPIPHEAIPYSEAPPPASAFNLGPNN